MSISDITSEAVLRAVDEYRSLGRDVFLKKYRFRRATRYMLVLDGDEFDSKAIVGVAHAYAVPDEGPLSSKFFSGGLRVGVRCLEDLGFTVVDRGSSQNPDWTRDELILAADFYRRFAPRIPGKTTFALSELADEIRAVAHMLGLVGDDTFRNPNGVYMKLMELRKYDPKYTGVGLGHSKVRAIEFEVWNLPLQKLRTSAGAIRRALGAVEEGSIPSAGVIDAEEPEIADAPEGAIMTRLHRFRERNRRIVGNKKAAFERKHGRLFCEACGFDFERTYGIRGAGFIECHHLLPVSQMQPGERTKLADLVLLCANCHRMVHARSNWLSPDELVLAMKATAAAKEGAP